MARERTIERNTSHGLSASPEYRVWSMMRARCENPSVERYPYYGGRGIRVCERWLKFENFYADMGPRPSPKHSIDRYPDGDGNYEPDNCRWATREEQRRNRDDLRMLTFEGRTQCLVDWARETGVPRHRVESRLARGWNIADALRRPADPRGGQNRRVSQ